MGWRMTVDSSDPLYLKMMYAERERDRDSERNVKMCYCFPFVKIVIMRF